MVQCLDRRIGDIETFCCKAGVRQDARNVAASGMDWQFTTADAGIKLKRLYPQI
jgi:hypothetical protein